MVDLGATRSSPLLVNFGPGVSPPKPKTEKSIMHWTLVSQVRQKLAGQSRGPCDKLATAGSDGNLLVTAIGMRGSTPVQITGVLVSLSTEGRRLSWLEQTVRG